jgi:hypothetical protein
VSSLDYRSSFKWANFLHKHACSYQIHITEVHGIKDMCDNFCKAFWPEVDAWVFIFQFFYFLMVGSAKYLPRKTFLFGATPAINNDLSLTLYNCWESFKTTDQHGPHNS